MGRAEEAQCKWDVPFSPIRRPSATVETGSIIVPLLEPQGPKDRHLRVSSIAYA
ncbi:hypothetical protein M9458_018590, partial [Cirrhinus mrigala]